MKNKQISKSGMAPSRKKDTQITSLYLFVSLMKRECSIKFYFNKLLTVAKFLFVKQSVFNHHLTDFLHILLKY